MKEDYLITIHSKAERRGGEDDSIELTTRGSFVRRGRSYYIIYKETQATGFEGCTTAVKVEGSGRVSMLRYGPAASQLVIEKGRRHMCLYDTGYGSMTLSVTADEIKSSLDESGGSVSFSYLIDIEDSPLSRNSVEITVKPAL